MRKITILKFGKGVVTFNFGTKEPKDVILVTPINELILIKGNDEVGFDHICKRHTFWSTNIYLKNNKYKL